MDEIEEIETEWGSELHRELIAYKHRKRIEWRNSPEALEEMKRFKEAGPFEIDWSTVRPASARSNPDPIDEPPKLSPEENEAATQRMLEWLRADRELSELRQAEREKELSTPPGPPIL